MLDTLLTLSVTTGSMSSFMICTAVSLLLGAVIAGAHMYRNRYSKNFIMTLIIMPVLVQAVILLVNGNLGTGVAVMGAFSLVRFRSVPGNSREIASIFLAMAVGLATGTGYIGIAALMTVCVSAAILVLQALPIGERRKENRDLKITVPENLNFEGVFDELMEKYTVSSRLLRVRTTNMGSLYELDYHVQTKSGISIKEFLDEIRCRNGNLSVVCNYASDGAEEL